MRAAVRSRPTTSRAVQEIARGRRALLAADPRIVLGAAIVLQWAFVLGLGLSVRRAGWIFYQGGDQLWYYTGGWALAHGTIVQPLVGYLGSALEAPLAAVVGPNIGDAYPPIILVDVLVLLPAALLALYGTARLIAGKAFGYGVVAVWLLLPLIGIWYTNNGYHERFTEATLPQVYGLTAMADFPTMVAAIVSAYFCARVLFTSRPAPFDAAAGGIVAGAALAIKPSAALFLAGPLLAFAVARVWRHGAIFIAALLPAVITLALWKYRGYGYLPLLHSSMGAPTAAGTTAAGAPLALPHYFSFDWNHFVGQLDQIREHFWSARLVEWVVIGGLIGLGRVSGRALALVGGWFAAFVLVKGGYSSAGIEDSSLLRLLMPTIPAFTILAASLVFVIPGMPRRIVRPEPTPQLLGRRGRLAVLAGSLVVTAVAPFAAIAAAHPLGAEAPTAVKIQTPLVPVTSDLGLRAQRRGTRVALRWTPQSTHGGPVFYHVFRSPAGSASFSCDTNAPAAVCLLVAEDLGTTREPRFVDARAGRSPWQYRVGVAANWLNDPAQGDVYVLGKPVTTPAR